MSDLRGFPLGHRRLMARAAVRMTPSTIRKGSQVFRNPAQLESGKGEESCSRNHGNGQFATDHLSMLNFKSGP